MFMFTNFAKNLGKILLKHGEDKVTSQNPFQNKMRPRSIQWRIQLWHSLLLALVVTTLLIAFYQNQRKIIYQDLDRQITAPLNRILPHLASPHHEGRPKPFDHDFKPRDHQLENSPANLEEIVAQLVEDDIFVLSWNCLLYTSPSPRDQRGSRMPSSA